MNAITHLLLRDVERLKKRLSDLESERVSDGLQHLVRPPLKPDAVTPSERRRSPVDKLLSELKLEIEKAEESIRSEPDCDGWSARRLSSMDARLMGLSKSIQYFDRITAKHRPSERSEWRANGEILRLD